MGWRHCGKQSHSIVPVVGHKTCLPLIPLQSSLLSLALTVLFCVARNQLMLPLLILLLPVGTDTMNILPNPGDCNSVSVGKHVFDERGSQLYVRPRNI